MNATRPRMVLYTILHFKKQKQIEIFKDLENPHPS